MGGSKTVEIAPHVEEVKRPNVITFNKNILEGSFCGDKEFETTLRYYVRVGEQEEELKSYAMQVTYFQFSEDEEGSF